jgi:Ca-activated chloride channel family protein
MKIRSLCLYCLAPLCLMLAVGGFGVSQNRAAADEDQSAAPGQLAIIGPDGGSIGLCPLKHTDVEAEISGFVARVTVKQEFSNPTAEPIEAIYTFPLSQDAAVDRMEMRIGDRVIKGEIRRREEARAIYEAAKQAGQTASLLDQERPNIFTQSVANIMPGEKIEITISYVELLKYADGEFEFSFPMVVGPRYIPGGGSAPAPMTTGTDTPEVPDASKITPPITPKGTRAGHDISLRVAIDGGVPLRDIESKLHEVKISGQGETRAVVALANRATIPNKDFVLRFRVAGDDVQTGLFAHGSGDGTGYFTLIFMPPEAPPASYVTPKEMIFVIDTSGSQQGWPIEKAKETMALCIDQMNPGDTFQLVAFSNDAVPCFDKPQPNTAETRAKAQSFLAGLEGAGGTEMMKAVLAALDPPADPERLRIVCFMTDGYVGNDFEIVDTIQKHIGSARFFSFGIGNSVNRFLLDEMAKVGRGAVEYVLLDTPGTEPAERFYKRIAKPLLTDIEIVWDPAEVADVYPERIPDLFDSAPLIVKGRYLKPYQGTIEIQGKLGGRLWGQDVEVEFPRSEPRGDAIATLWAREKIDDLMSQDWLGQQTGNPRQGIGEEITQVALEYRIMSQYTSFVAVEERVVNIGGRQKTVAVPVEMPEGVSYEGIFGEEMAANMRYATAGRRVVAQSSAGKGASYGVGGAAGGGISGWTLSASDTEKKDAPDTGVLDTSKMSAEEKRAYLRGLKLAAPLRDLPELVAEQGHDGSLSMEGKPEVSDGKVEVQLWLADLSDANLKKLKTLGVEVLYKVDETKLVIALMPVANLDKIVEIDFVRWIEPLDYR